MSARQAVALASLTTAAARVRQIGADLVDNPDDEMLTAEQDLALRILERAQRECRLAGVESIDPYYADELVATEADPVAVEPEPEPGHAEPAPAWTVCGTCRGLGRLIVADLTQQLRAQGHPFTVTGPCPRCAGGGGS